MRRMILLTIFIVATFFPALPSLSAYDKVSFHLSANGKVKSGKWKGLATGLEMMWQGRSLRGDGVGLGVPMVQDGNEFFFSSQAEMDEGGALSKRFRFNLRGMKQKDGSYRLAKAENNKGAVTVTYNVAQKSVSIMLTDLNVPRGTTLHILNHLSSYTFVKFQDSSLKKQEFPNMVKQHVNSFCGQGSKSDAAYFYTHDEGLSFGMVCHQEAHLTATRQSQKGNKFAALDYAIPNVGFQFYYHLYFSAPQNRPQY